MQLAGLSETPVAWEQQPQTSAQHDMHLRPIPNQHTHVALHALTTSSGQADRSCCCRSTHVDHGGGG
jgi:hypothetical protein